MSLIQLEQIYKIYNEGKENEVRALNGVTLSIGRGDLALLLGLPFWAEGLAALLQGIWRRAKGRPLFKAGSLDAWLRRKGGPVSVFYVFCALALAGALAALRTAQL